MEEKNTIRKLFVRFVNDQCTPEEIERLMSYFGDEGQQPHLRELILRELENDTQSSVSSSDALEQVYKSLIAQVNQTKQLQTNPVQPWYRFAWHTAAVWAILITSVGGLFYNLSKLSKNTPELAMISVSTGSNEQKKITLNDGSTVWLNSESIVKFPKNFPNDSRNVSLVGEAYFEVKKDHKRPFSVVSKGLTTKVVGTSFNIRTNPGDSSIAVSVLTGKVNVSLRDHNQTLDLIPGQQAVYRSSSTKLSLNEGINTIALTSWKEGKMQFRDETFGQVCQYLERRFNVKITLDPRIENCPVHADFNQNESVDLILKMVLISLQGKMIHREDSSEYHLTGKGCPNLY